MGSCLSMSEKKAKVKEVVGLATGDRHVEAAGRAEKRAVDLEDPLENVDEGAISEEEHSVRQEHGDLSANGEQQAG
jgi:uncharacterized protein YjbJ (UPF0337 family)